MKLPSPTCACSHARGVHADGPYSHCLLCDCARFRPVGSFRWVALTVAAVAFAIGYALPL